MQLAYPQGRIYLVVASSVAVLAVMALVRKRQALRRLARQGINQPGTLVRPGVQIFRCVLMMLAAALLGIAVLGPQWGWTEEEAPPRNGRDVLILLDVSRSMLAEDVLPNRLERAKADLHNLAGFLERAGGYRIGLLAFAERAAVMCPLTSDYRCFVEELDDASLSSLRIRGRAAWGDGTQIGLALERAGQTIDDANAAYTDVLLVSDGDDMARETLAAAESLSRRSITVHALGLGDSVNASPIPVQDGLGRPAQLRYRGELVYTHLQEAVLRAIAETTHGRYFVAGTSYRDLDRQFGELLAGKKSLDRQTAHSQRRGIHRFAWFVMPALLLLLLHGFLSEARRTSPAAAERPNYFAWVRRRSSISHDHESQRGKLLHSLTLLALFCMAAGALATSDAPVEDSNPWAAFDRGNELLRQAQQAGLEADASTLLQAQQLYQVCLSKQTWMLNAGSLFDNARHNLEMTKLLLMQINGSGPNPDKSDSKEPPSDSRSREANESAAKDEPKSPGKRGQQQSQEKSQTCSTCQNGQTQSTNARKMIEGGHDSRPGKGAPSSSGKSSENQAAKSQSAPNADSSHGEEPGSAPEGANKEDKQPQRGREPKPDASGLFGAESTAAKQSQPTPARGIDGNGTNGGPGKGKTARLMDPKMQAAEQRLQDSIQRIEKRRGGGNRGSESSPEDPATQNRYRDW